MQALALPANKYHAERLAMNQRLKSHGATGPEVRIAVLVLEGCEKQTMKSLDVVAQGHGRQIHLRISQHDCSPMQPL